MNLTEIILNTMWYKNGTYTTNCCKSIGNSNQEKIIDLDNCTIESPNGRVTINGKLQCDYLSVQNQIEFQNDAFVIRSNENGDLIFNIFGTNFIAPYGIYGTIATDHDLENIKLEDLKSVGIATCELMKAIPTLSSQLSYIEEIEDALENQEIETH